VSRLVVTVAEPEVLDGLLRAGVPEGVRLELWDLEGPGIPEVDVVVVPNYFVGREGFRVLHALPRLRVVQLPSAGYEHALPHLPRGVILCNGRGVHDAGTAELALALTLAAQRGIGDAVRAMPEGRWDPILRSSLADRRVLVLGYGSIGAAIGRRLTAFESEVVRVARSAREAPEGPVHAIEELMRLLPTVDIAISALPLTDATRGLMGAAALAAMPDGALLVNVGRGRVVDTEALLAELQAGRLRAALDVTDPEPLPADHPLWRAPNTIITPHVGGYTNATTPRLVALVRRQIGELLAGREPANIVART
jgi:phosphoglycerate dehydrogenase-like enzyme